MEIFNPIILNQMQWKLIERVGSGFYFYNRLRILNDNILNYN